MRLRTDAPAVSNLPWPQIAGSVAAVLLMLGVLWWKPWHQRGAAPVQSERLAANPERSGADAASDSAEADPASAGDAALAAASDRAMTASTADRADAVRRDRGAGRSTGARQAPAQTPMRRQGWAAHACA